MPGTPKRTHLCIVILASLFLLPTSQNCQGDGLVVKKRDYAGSLEEASQEAVIIFQTANEPGQAIQDLILSIEVAGKASEFAWVIPFPNEPETFEEDDGLFQELFDYVEFQRYSHQKNKPGTDDENKIDSARSGAVDVISRKIVGDYEVTVVRETAEGGLNPWLKDNGYQTLDDADDVLEFYRQKNYVYACIRYSSETLATDGVINSHPLRFRFKTGGRDGMYFPMRLTGLQEEPFDVTLYVFTPSWVNDKLNQFGYHNRGFHLSYRDWDTDRCDPNAGKLYSSPADDPFLKRAAKKLPLTSAIFQALYPGQRFYLTKLQAFQMNPKKVRSWSDDLWLFPYYTDRGFVPYDALAGGVASAAWPDTETVRPGSTGPQKQSMLSRTVRVLAILAIFTIALITVPLVLRRMLVSPTKTAGNPKEE